MITIDKALLQHMPLPDHAGDADKDARGRVLAIGGSLEVPGGILLASVAALRAGAGKLQIATCASIAPMLGLSVPEALVAGLPETPCGGIDPSAFEQLRDKIERCDAVLLGPGMDDAPAVAALTRAIIGLECDTGLVLDAAALGELNGEVALLTARHCDTVLTPHAGEMAGMLGIDRDEVIAEPERIATETAARLGCIVALKGGQTVIAAPDGRTFRYEGGGIGLATSGSGDTLAGIVTGLMARGADGLTAAIWGVYLHGQAGRRLAKRRGRIGFLARELLAEVPVVMAKRCR